MRRVIQEDTTGCGLACIAMLSGRKYKEVRKAALSELQFDEGGEFYTGTSDLVYLGQGFDLKIGKRRRKFKGFDLLPNKAILAINYKEKSDSWHWVVFHRNNKEQYVLDPKKSIKTAKRTDLTRIAKNTTHWLGVE